ncbi:D-inositol-3-phosphate glycosyltransferase [Ralstonia mannitolilytica]|uniref:glycosyltransferase family 4 protein n=1 Tax=Ralstonia mannitolilytica TaxID=105219 RepID=UPI0028F4D162|nr:glycosyltransferase family 4 protein [Ralstonia mannitolilytica]CAJ0681136.1 D-inositol-3-phosphate glycosyltransferase [Ralstonia mannitolilytica]
MEFSRAREVRPSEGLSQPDDHTRLLLISTTVPETFQTILKKQPSYLATHFNVILATSPSDTLAKVEADEQLSVCQVPMVRGINVLSDLVSVMRMVWVLRTIKPALVHSYTPKAGLVTMLAAWLCRVPVRVHTFTGLIFPTSTGFRRQLLIWIDRLICLCATEIVPEGNGVKNDLERFHITKKPLHVIGHGNIAGVDTDFFSTKAAGIFQEAGSLRSALSIGADEFVFCFVGRLNKDKGVAELIEAFTSLNGMAHLILVGSVDSTAPVDDITLAEIEAHSRIHVLGFMEDIRPALLASDILVLPSYREGFPNVVLQAGAMELPVIATDINGSNEIIERGLNGWLVPARDARALQMAMQQAIDMPAIQRKEIGQRARARIVQRFERREHWKRMVQFYDGLLRRTGVSTTEDS